MAYLDKCLLWKYEVMSLNPQHQHKSQAWQCIPLISLTVGWSVWDVEVNLMKGKVGWRARYHRLLQPLEESWSVARGIRRKMAPRTPVIQLTGTEARAVVVSPIFMEVLTGDDAPPTPSGLPHQAGLSLGIGIDSNTVYKLMCCAINSDVHPDVGLWSVGVWFQRFVMRLHHISFLYPPFLVLFPQWRHKNSWSLLAN